MTIADLVPDDKAVITGFTAVGARVVRMCEMGLVLGTDLKMIRKAPLGDPIEISVRGARLSIRVSEAALIQVAKSE